MRLIVGSLKFKDSDIYRKYLDSGYTSVLICKSNVLDNQFVLFIYRPEHDTDISHHFSTDEAIRYSDAKLKEFGIKIDERLEWLE